MSKQKLTGGMSRGKQPRVNYKGDTSRSMQKLVRGGKYVTDISMAKIERLIQRLGLSHNTALSDLQGGVLGEYYHLTEVEYNVFDIHVSANANAITVDDDGNITFSDNATVTGNFTVNGTTTTINTETLDVEDRNIILGNVAVPSDVTANGGGITLLGATNKTLLWDSVNENWTLSEHVNIVTGKEFKINNVSVLNATTLGSAVVNSSLTSVGTLSSLTMGGNITMPDGGTIGQTAGPLLTFDDTNNYLEITGCNVGLGTTAPEAKLHVSWANATPQLILERTGTSTAKYSLGVSSNIFTIRDLATAEDRLVIDASGMVGIGTSTPGKSLDVAGDIRIRGDAGTINFYRVTDPLDIATIEYNNTDEALKFWAKNKDINFSASDADQDAPHLFIKSTDGNVGIGIANPDAQVEIMREGDQLKLSYNTEDSAVFTVDDNGDLTITPSGEDVFISTKVNATTFIGALTGNASGSAATVTSASQPAITSLGTLTTLTLATDASIKGSDSSPALSFGADGVMTAHENISMADGKGIDFSAYTDGSVAGTTTSQLLDDYEEGTWAASCNGGGTWTLDFATYTKIGRMVTYICRFTGDNKTATAGTTVITGAPYTNTGYAAGVYMDSTNIVFSGETMMQLTTIYLPALTLTGSGIVFSGSYFV